MGKHTGKRSSKYQKRDFKNDKAPVCALDKKTSNDVSYYNKNSTDYKLATQIPWAVTAGLALPVDTIHNQRFDADSYAALSGIARINFVCGPGYAALATDPINKAMSQIISTIYAGSSATELPFDQASLAMYLTATGSIANLIAVAKRALKCIPFWITRNVAYPRMLLGTMGLDYDDMIANQASYVTRLNALIRQFNAMEVPTMFDVGSRQYALCHNIYLDEDSPLGQIYYWMPSNYYEYVDVESKAVSKALSFSNMTELLDIISNTMDTWYHSQDMYYIRGQLSRALSATEVIHLDETDVNAMINPVTDAVMELQLMNATILNEVYNLDITGDPLTGTLKWEPRVATSTSIVYTGHGSAQLLRAYKPDISADDNMEMTRFTNFFGDMVIDENGDYYPLTDCSPEIITGMDFYKYVPDSSVHYAKRVTAINSNEFRVTNTDPGSYSRALSTSLGSAPFRFLPYVGVVNADTNEWDGLFGDIYNYTPLSRTTWYQLQRVALFSLYTVRMAAPNINRR